MESQQTIQRLAAFVNESAYQFALRHSDCTKRGALLQCWVPRQEEQCGQRVLTTQEAPFAILGSSDQLARYKFESSKYFPPCDGTNTRCGVSRVFASVQGGLAGDASSEASNGSNRSAEALSFGIHSNLLLPVYDEEGEGDSSNSSSSSADEPVAVLELSMHEVDVDFTQTCTTLREVAQGHGFWLPCLRSARSLDMQEVPMAAPAAASSSAGSLGDSSSSAPTAAGSRAQKQRSCTPVPPCGAAAELWRTGRPMLRRRSIHLADQQEQRKPGEGLAAASGPQQQQQQRQKSRCKKASRRQSVIYTEYLSSNQAASDAAASRLTSSRGRQRVSELSGSALGPLAGAAVGQQQQQQLAGSSISSTCMAQPVPPAADAHHNRRRSFDNHGFGRFGARSSSSGCASRQQGHQTYDPAAIGASLRRSATPPHDSCSSRSGAGFWSNLSSRLSSYKHPCSNSSSARHQQQQQDISHLAVEHSSGLDSSRMQWQQPPPPPVPQPADFGPLVVERSAGSGSKLMSPFQCGAPPTAPHHRTFTPPHHPQRHIVERGHAARSASANLHMQGAMGAAGQRAKLREQHQRQEQEHHQQQYTPQQPRDNQQQRDQQVHQQQQQPHDMPHWQDLQQQQQHEDQHPQLRGWQSSSFYSATNMRQTAAASASTVDAAVTAAAHDHRTTSAPLPVIDKAGSTSSASSSTQPSKERVRALVAHGGAFRHTGLDGMWSYVGGAQKLVGVPKHASIAELQGQLGANTLSSAAGQCKIKYALPTSPRAAGAGPTYVDLENEEDVEIMWEEVDDYAASHKGFRLQLYVESADTAAAIAAAASMPDTIRGGSSISGFSAATSGPFGAAASSSLYASSDSGRGSGGSDSSSGRLPAYGHGLRAGSSGLQAEGLQGQGSGPAADSPVFNVSAQVSGLSIASGHSRGMSSSGQAFEQAAAGGVSRMLMQQQQLKPLPEQQGVTLVPFYSQQLGTADAAAAPVVDARRTSSDIAVPDVHGVLLLPENTDPQQQQQQQLQHAEEDEFLSCMETSSLAATAGISRPGAQPAAPTAAAAPSPAAPKAAVQAAAAGDASKCTSAGTTTAGASNSASSISSTHSGQLGAGSSAGTSMMGELHKQKQQQLKALVEELEGRVEVIMPADLNIVRYLGGGAFGEVYLCRWHGVEVAVKSLSPSLISNDSSGTPCADACADLLKEAAVLASLHHPNIVSVFGMVLPPLQLLSNRSRTTSSDLASSIQQQQLEQHGSTAEQLAAAADELTDELLAAAAGTSRSSAAPSAAGSAAVTFTGCRAAMASALSQGHPPAPAIVTEFLSLGSLHSAINCRAEWLRGSMARAKLLLDTARGLDYLHSKRLVHFDLKSANLLVTMRDKVPCVKLADMGLTKQRRQTFVSGINSLRGTLPWIAPEIVKHPETVTEKADIWSFGVCMWQLWTMQEPFEGVHLHALLHQLSAPGGLSLPVPGTPDWQEPECPPEPAPGWRQLMQRCWQQAAGERPSARQLVSALEEMMEALRAARRRTSEPASGPR